MRFYPLAYVANIFKVKSHREILQADLRENENLAVFHRQQAVIHNIEASTAEHKVSLLRLHLDKGETP